MKKNIIQLCITVLFSCWFLMKQHHYVKRQEKAVFGLLSIKAFAEKTEKSWMSLQGNYCQKLSKHAVKTKCCIKEKYSFEMLVSSFSLVLKCARLVQEERWQAARRPEYPKEVFFSSCFYKIHYPIPQKQQRIWKTKHLSVIQWSFSNNSFAAPWQYFNTMALLYSIQWAEGSTVRAGKTSFYSHHLRHHWLSHQGTDLHWFCDKWIRLRFNWLCAFAVPQDNCTRARQLKTCCWDQTSVILCTE